ncbi:hypothetical protein SAMN03159511_4070 [Pseudomonas sp. NFACC19-2]|nr:hypothetical protein SAMN03159511_4070 [Pseudomonas sp. NFACC19-2]
MAGQGMDEELRSEIFKNAKQLHGVPYLVGTAMSRKRSKWSSTSMQ